MTAEPSAPPRPGTVAARVTGRALAGAFALAGRLRPADKPLHPVGSVRRGRFDRFGLEQGCGVDWLDEPGSDEALVRLSRAAGLPSAIPDFLGIAMRVPVGDPGAGGHADLLFTSTGEGPLGRYVLAPARRANRVTYSTLLPYRTPRGPVLLSMAPEPDEPGLCFATRVATPRGPWRQFGLLRITHEQAAGDVSFDAMANPAPGLEPYEWVRQLRGQAYRAARRSRGDLRAAP